MGRSIVQRNAVDVSCDAMSHIPPSLTLLQKSNQRNKRFIPKGTLHFHQCRFLLYSRVLPLRFIQVSQTQDPGFQGLTLCLRSLLQILFKRKRYNVNKFAKSWIRVGVDVLNAFIPIQRVWFVQQVCRGYSRHVLHVVEAGC